MSSPRVGQETIFDKQVVRSAMGVTFKDANTVANREATLSMHNLYAGLPSLPARTCRRAKSWSVMYPCHKIYERIVTLVPGDGSQPVHNKIQCLLAIGTSEALDSILQI